MTLALALLLPPGAFGGGSTPTPVVPGLPCLMTQAGDGIVTQAGDPICIRTNNSLLLETGAYFILEGDVGYLLLE